jgi:hypothetical protein
MLLVDKYKAAQNDLLSRMTRSLLRTTMLPVVNNSTDRLCFDGADEPGVLVDSPGSFREFLAFPASP